MRDKLEAIQSLLSDIKALSDLNTIIRNYVTDDVDPFVTTYMTTFENEIRYLLSRKFSELFNQNLSASLVVQQVPKLQEDHRALHSQLLQARQAPHYPL